MTNGQEVTSYQYDSLHRRISKTSNQKTVHFLYFGQREIGLFDPNTSTITEFRVLGLGKGAELGASIALELNDALYCPLHDHRGNIVALVDPTTSKGKECYRYTAFGEREIYDEAGTSLSKSTLHNPWGFASKRHDDETGFVYFSRRYFAPETGRWVTPDPLGFADGPNLYAYVHNNPLTRFDLYGLYGLMDDDNFDLNAQVATAQFLARFAVEFAIAEAHATVGLVSLGVGVAHYTAALAYNPQDTINQTRKIISDISLESLASSVAEGFKNDPARAFANTLSTVANPTGGLTRSVKGKILSALGKEESAASLANNAISAGKKIVEQQRRTGRAKNHLEPYKPIKPNEPLPGAHSTFRRNPVTGDISHYATWAEQTNFRDPSPWKMIKRYDGPGSGSHVNKVLKRDVDAPHIHDPSFPGGIREPELGEIPKRGNLS